MPHILLVFSSAATAEFNVAGVPAGARAAHALASLRGDDAVDGCTLIVDRGWEPSGHLILECERLAAGLRLSFSPEHATGAAVVVQGEALVAALARQHGEWGRQAVLLAIVDARVRSPASRGAGFAESAALRQLDRASRQILAATGKRGDGIVSRYINRPISRAISRRLLQVPGLVPSHASAGTALLGIAMVFALFLGGNSGLIAGALLFQAASIFDGVDGEMARATYRTSEEGATLDSIIDACTNLAFIMGVSVNVGLSGDILGAAAGAISVVTLAFGLLLIGRCSSTPGSGVNFDIVKGQLRERGKRTLLIESLIHLTMRDFYALGCALLILAGLTQFVLLSLATITLGWLCVTVAMLARSGRWLRSEAVINRSQIILQGASTEVLTTTRRTALVSDSIGTGR